MDPKLSAVAETVQRCYGRLPATGSAERVANENLPSSTARELLADAIKRDRVAGIDPDLTQGRCT